MHVGPQIQIYLILIIHYRASLTVIIRSCLHLQPCLALTPFIQHAFDKFDGGHTFAANDIVSEVVENLFLLLCKFAAQVLQRKKFIYLPVLAFTFLFNTVDDVYKVLGRLLNQLLLLPSCKFEVLRCVRLDSVQLF
jgi:hypothetical protein